VVVRRELGSTSAAIGSAVHVYPVPVHELAHLALLPHLRVALIEDNEMSRYRRLSWRVRVR
jgi:hypothetical protein